MSIERRRGDERRKDGQPGFRPVNSAKRKGTAMQWSPYSRVSGSNYFDEGGESDSFRFQNPNDWSVRWADLMMTMFVMFAVMLAYFLSERNIKDAFHSEVQSKTTGGGTSGESSDGGDGGNDIAESDTDEQAISPERLLELTENAIKETDIEDVEVLLQDDKTIKISLRGPLLFDSGRADLREETRSFLAQVARVIGKTNNEVHVVGHTDTFPIHNALFPTNWELSVSLAAAVARYMIMAADLAPGRFTVMGNSMYRPVAENDTPENKQLNRRVEIIITKKIYQEPAL